MASNAPFASGGKPFPWKTCSRKYNVSGVWLCYENILWNTFAIVWLTGKVTNMK